MPFFFNPKIQSLSEDGKSVIRQVMADNRITQRDLEDYFHVDQSTVSRWTKFGSDLHLPFSIVPALNDEKVFPLALAIIQHQATPLGLLVTKRVDSANLNGSLDDEQLAMVETLGRMISEAKSNNRKKRIIRAQIQHMRELLNQAEAELDA